MARIIGVLTDPFEAPIPNTEIRFSAITTEGEVFTGSDASEITGEDGSYDFPLAEGRYLVEVLNVNEYHESGFVLVDEYTPTPITLTELVRYSRPYTPPEVLEGKPVWDELFEEIVANDEWDRQGESQVRDLDVFANEDKTIHKDDSNYMAKETHTVSSGSSVQSTQSLAYEDEHLQQASTHNIKGEVPLASSQEALGAYKNSDGTTEANHTLTLSDTTGSMVSSTTGSTRSETFTQDSSELSSEVLAEGTSVTSSETASNDTVAAETLKYVDANELVDALIKQGIRIEGEPEAFTKLMRNQGKTEYVVQADKTTIQTTDDDGDPLAMATFDGATGDIHFNGKVHMANEGDFRGEEGWSYITEKTYSNSPEGPWAEVYSEHTYALEQDYRFKASDEEGTLEPINEPRVVKLAAKDGADGDKYYIIYEYSEDKASWHSKYSTSDIWRRFKAVVNDVPEDDWSDAERMTGPAGQDGWVPEWDRYYGYGQIDGTVMAIPDLLVDPSDPHSVDHRYWTHDWDTNDAWIYERLIWWSNQQDYLASRHSAGYPDWTLGIEPAALGEWPTAPTKVKPEFGVDYFDGYSQAIVNIYKRADSKPSTPSSALTYTFATKVLSGSLEGWTTEVPDGNAPLWASSGSFTAQGASDTISPNEWAGVALMTKEGASMFYEYQYSAEANGPWHSDQMDTDYYVRERTVTTAYTGDAPVYGEWSSPALFRTDGYTPEKGVDYFDGDFHSTIFKASENKPSTPTGGSYNGNTETPPSSWTDEPNYSSDERLWASTAVYKQQSDLTWSHAGWSTPVQWSGEPATNRATVTLYKSSLSKPSVPASNITYTFATGAISGNLGGWTTTPPANAAGKLWWTMATAFADGVTSTDVISSSEWASVELLVSNGEAGEHGAGSIVINFEGDTYPTPHAITVNATDPAHVEYWYVNAVGRSSKEYDIITFQKADGSKAPKQYMRGESVWEEFTLFLDGNVMVEDTLAASALKAGTTLTDTLYISSNETSKEMTLTGSGDYRQWAGHEDPTQAKMSLHKDGTLNVTGANVNGHINAVTMTFVDGATVGGDVPPEIDNDNAVQEANEYANQNFVNAVTYGTDIAEIQAQLDKSITSWFGNGTPTPSNYPASGWVSAEDKNVHLGDLYYDNDEAASYRWSLEGSTYVWIRVVDSGIEAALAAAATAQDTADSKRRVFFVTPVAPYDRGDLWDTGSGIRRADVASATTFNDSHWLWSSDAAGAAANAELAAKNHADAKVAAEQARADAYADGVADEAELAAIAAADAKAALAEQNAKIYADGEITQSEAQTKAAYEAYADAAETAAVVTANAYADGIVSEEEARAIAHAEAQANLAQVTAEAYADGIVSEEEARAIADAQAKADAAEANANGYTDSVSTGLNSLIVTAQNTADQAKVAAANAQSTADGKVETFYSGTAPTGASEGDIWVHTDQGNQQYMYTSGSWTSIQDTGIVQAQTTATTAVNSADQAAIDAATAQSTADGKVRTYYQTNVPTSGMSEGDIWVDTDDGNNQYMYASGAWRDIQDQAIYAEASRAEAAAKAHADAQANLAQVTAETYADGVATEAEQAAIASAQAKVDAAEVRAKAYADGQVTEAEAAAIKEAERLADLAEANAKAASDPKGSASAAEASANSYTENRIYPTQDSIQISGNYQSGVSGWAIDKYGNAEFNNAVFRGTVYANNGVFRGDVYADNGWFKGTVYADKISGDVVSGRIYSANAAYAYHNQTYWGEWVHFDRVTISGSSSKTRTLVITVGTKVGTGHYGAGDTFGQMRLTGSFGTVYSEVYENTAPNVPWVVREQTLIVTVPANTTGYMDIQVRAKSEGASTHSRCYAYGVNGTKYGATLVPNGSDLS